MPYFSICFNAPKSLALNSPKDLRYALFLRQLLAKKFFVSLFCLSVITAATDFGAFVQYGYFSADYPKPWITCPTDVVATLAPNAKEHDITGLLSQPQSNVKNIHMYPDKYRSSLVFPSGLTVLTYVASNEIGETANCTTVVTIQGKKGFNFKMFIIIIIIIIIIILLLFIYLVFFCVCETNVLKKAGDLNP